MANFLLVLCAIMMLAGMIYLGYIIDESDKAIDERIARKKARKKEKKRLKKLALANATPQPQS